MVVSFLQKRILNGTAVSRLRLYTDRVIIEK